MKAVKIGYNHQAENIYKSKRHVAETSLNQAKTFVSELIPLETLEKDIDLFKQSFVEYTQTFIKNDSVLKLLDPTTFINLTALASLEKRYKEYRQPDNLNFDIYATTENQVKEYDYLLKLCELLNSHPKQTELIHQLRNITIPLVEHSTGTFHPCAITISMLK